jgi:signal-transduction protein with cAMP-binding, CBS, and nucleotidyltransferase domain
MQIGIKVGDIMTRDLVSINPGKTIGECARMMSREDIGTILVEDHGKLRGALTEKDIIWALTKKQDIFHIKVSDIMLRKISTIKPSKDIYDALLRMKNQKVAWLPVTVRGNVIGMLTINDILKIEPSLFDIVSQNWKVREEDEKMDRKRRALTGKESWIKEGQCIECEAYGILYNLGGKLLCEDCCRDKSVCSELF